MKQLSHITENTDLFLKLALSQVTVALCTVLPAMMTQLALSAKVPHHVRNEWHVHSANKTQDLQLDLLRIGSVVKSMEDRTTILDPHLPCAVYRHLHLCLTTAIKGRGLLP